MSALASEAGGGISSGGRGYVRSFNRFELKYVLPIPEAEAFRAELAGFTAPDPHSGEAGYPVNSVYWDSPDLTFFWEKVDGEKYRRKLRFRTYEGTDDVFVEIKQRIDRTVQKRRVRWPRAKAAEVFGGKVRSEVRGDVPVDDPVGKEAVFLCRHYGLEPKMAVGYRRRALFGIAEPDLRITFDTRLRYDAHALDFGVSLDDGELLLADDICVLEIKFDSAVPSWLVRLSERSGLELKRFSKYCTAVDRAFFGGRYT